MSLLSGASVWQNDQSSVSTTPKKRMPTMNRKASRTKPSDNGYSGPDVYLTEENPSVMGNVVPSGSSISLMEDQRRNHERSERVHAMLNQLHEVSADNDGNRLADFVPLGHPAVQQKKPTNTSDIPQPQMSNDSYAKPNRPLAHSSMHNVNPDDSNVSKFSSYRYAYDPSKIPATKAVAPYYAKMGTGKSSDDKLMEKINYMIHLLEEQQLEKTNNVMEEFLLYTFLGVFMIYIVDGFSRAGKYIR